MSGPPHFASPFRLGPDGKPVLFEQDSTEEIGSCVYNIAVCPPGGKMGDPEFGMPDVLFRTVPLQTALLGDAIQRFEPRVEADLGEDDDGAASVVTYVLGLFPSDNLFPSDESIQTVVTGGPGAVDLTIVATPVRGN